MQAAMQNAANITTKPTPVPAHTKMSPLEVSVEWWSRWSDILGITAIFVGGFLALITAFGWGFSWKAGKLKDALLEEQIKTAPLKVPVTTATALLNISVSAELARSFTDTKLSDGSVATLDFGKSDTLIKDDGTLGPGTWTIFLRSDKAEHWGNASKSEFFWEFHPHSFAPIGVPENVEELLDVLDVVSVSLWGFPPNSEISGGTLALTLNGTTKKTFTIPKIKTDRFGSIALLFETNSAPVPLTRNVVDGK
jgi:hypothetical protein